MTRDHAPDFSPLSDALRGRVEAHWETYRGNTDAPVLDGPVLETLPLVWACSEFVARTCALHPAVLQELHESGDLERAYEGNELGDRIVALAGELEDEQDLYRTLRRMRRREAVRIAWRDLAGWADLEEVMAVMTELADASIQLGLATLHELACEQRGTPRDEQGEPVALSVLGLGKLGGRELNFSSDIDLILAYRADGETDAPRPMSNHEFFSKLGTRLIHALDHITEDGYVFRVDMRLRPNGSSGPLALSFDAMIQYYQVHGRDWERYAMVKARPVAGGIDEGRWLLDQLRPFIYRKYLDFGAVQAIRDMKQIIDREVRRKHGEGDIKLGRGGIREIEFIVQSLQLIRGGREPGLQTSRIHSALRELAGIDALEADTVNSLESCYRFLRNLEHRLQMLADEQTHVLPKDEVPRARLALAMGETDWTGLQQAVNEVKDRVNDTFQRILSEKPPPGDSLDTMADVWSARIERDTALPLLRDTGYEDPETTFNLLRQLRRGKSYHAHSKVGRERLDRLMPALVQLAGRSGQPHETLSRLTHFIEAVGRRSAYLILLIENPLALEQLVRLCAASAWVSNWISRYPLLLEELLSPISSTPESFEQELDEEIEHRLQPLDPGDIEAHMEAFREIHHAQMLRIAAADIFESIDRPQVAHRICLVAEKLLDAVVAHCVSELSPGIGRPAQGDSDEPPAFGIVGYGKLGSRELGYNSDIDLVFMHQVRDPTAATTGGRRPVSNDQYFARLAQRITHVIATRTPSGVMYEIDHRLRPSGGSGPLVTSLQSFHSYQVERAWTWEHQALVRARVVTGPPALAEAFESVRREVLCSRRDLEKLRGDVKQMRTKMRSANDRSTAGQFDLKQCPGGIIDIEFIVQYYVLQYAHEHPDLAGPRNTLELLAAIDEAGLMSGEDSALLRDIYQSYLNVDHGHKLAEQALLLDTNTLSEERRAVAALWDRIFD
ncbi:MAG: bifunctional [glutamate--ammonia ligase]-adenylyl-L-tyrosine phosphorylase/[glutamate--ammonia-ligase] adenylyltransferase [Gammaproteobacteria bacterium]|nr:bifunctional [glutamate--ammonia ligase]-adenylyl-L-tyrosine phosphorylase/[glutamate--ammonia-ligase] adenylyltransferase [Gammaproteobacteria bacterium]